MKFHKNFKNGPRQPFVYTHDYIRESYRVLVADNDFQDLQKKAARLGGNVALMTPQRTAKGGYFGLQDYMTADVYRCENAK